MEKLQNRKDGTLKVKARPPRKMRLIRKTEMNCTGPTKRHTHSTIAGLEDLTAVVLDIAFALRRCETFLQATENEIQTIKARSDAALDAINIIRIGPNAYPTEDIKKDRKNLPRIRRK